jgi:hypothetical protein
MRSTIEPSLLSSRLLHFTAADKTNNNRMSEPFHMVIYGVFRAQADWTFILLSELPAKELCHLLRIMPPHSTAY